MNKKKVADELEEVLENLWINAEEKKVPVEISNLSDQNVHALENQGMIRIADQKVQLTDRGYAEARSCIRRHRLAERLLSDILQSPHEYIHSSGCKFEHRLQRELEEKVCTMLGHPKICPHGQPIPPGECCRRLEKEPEQLLAVLTETKVGEECTIAYLRSTESSDMRKLMVIGALPGTSIKIKQRFPSYHVEIGNSLFAIDEELARQIYVRKKGS